MSGRLIYLIGPSGSGKDTILQGLCRLMGERAYLAPRFITRPATDTERGSMSVSQAEFLRIERQGGFAMSWRANGLAYGVQADIHERLQAGVDVLVNGSREFLPEARRLYRPLIPVLLQVDQDTLRKRLVARGRESADEIHRRLGRNACYAELAKSGQPDIVTLDNSGSIERSIQSLYDYLHPTENYARHELAVDPVGHRQCGAAARL